MKTKMLSSSTIVEVDDYEFIILIMSSEYQNALTFSELRNLQNIPEHILDVINDNPYPTVPYTHKEITETFKELSAIVNEVVINLTNSTDLTTTINGLVESIHHAVTDMAEKRKQPIEVYDNNDLEGGNDGLS